MEDTTKYARQNTDRGVDVTLARKYILINFFNLRYADAEQVNSQKAIAPVFTAPASPPPIQQVVQTAPVQPPVQTAPVQPPVLQAQVQPAPVQPPPVQQAPTADNSHFLTFLNSEKSLAAMKAKPAYVEALRVAMEAEGAPSLETLKNVDELMATLKGLIANG